MLTSFLWSVIGPEKLHIYSVAFCLPNFLPNTHKIGAFWVILKLFLNFKIPHWDRNSQQNRNFRKFHNIFNQTFLFRGYWHPALTDPRDAAIVFQPMDQACTKINWWYGSIEGDQQGAGGFNMFFWGGGSAWESHFRKILLISSE